MSRSPFFVPASAFHCTLPLLAAGGSEPGTPERERAQLIHLFALDFAVMLAKSAAPAVTYTSAKVVLVGESNVGKSYLAHRIATGAPPVQGTIESTHGMKFWPLEPEKPSPAAAWPTEKPRMPSAFAEKLWPSCCG